MLQKHTVYILADFNTKIDSQAETGFTGSFGPEMNDVDDCLIQICHENQFQIMNTWL